MPLLDIHIVKGRSRDELDELMNAIHDSMVAAFKVPDRDRYQVVTEHEEGHLVMQDTGLGFERSNKRVLIHVTSKPRSQDMKTDFYRIVTENLGERCAIPPEDIMFSLIENSDADWSFAFGRAQFLTGEL